MPLVRLYYVTSSPPRWRAPPTRRDVFRAWRIKKETTGLAEFSSSSSSYSGTRNIISTDADSGQTRSFRNYVTRE